MTRLKPIKISNKTLTSKTLSRVASSLKDGGFQTVGRGILCWNISKQLLELSLLQDCLNLNVFVPCLGASSGCLMLLDVLHRL